MATMLFQAGGASERAPGAARGGGESGPEFLRLANALPVFEQVILEDIALGKG